jgi:hypothetical protein
MRALTNTGICVFLLSFCAFAGMKESKKNRHSFTVGPALPISDNSAKTIPDSNYKNLKLGWDGSWTFTGKPFDSFDNVISGIGLGGKVSYSRWERDSTLTPVAFLGIQGIVRYSLPLKVEFLDIFAQAGGGLFMGEYGFTDPDTVDWTKPDFAPKVKTTQYCPGFNLGAGIDFFIVELMPLITMVFTKNDVSTWLSLNLGITF